MHTIFLISAIAECCALTSDDVAKFLDKIELPQYTEAFRAKDITGKLLLEASTQLLTELGVASPLHQMKITQLFRRELQGSQPKYPTSHLTEFLLQNKLDKYVDSIETQGIDGDMILKLDKKVIESVLKEVGITSKLDITKVLKYKTFCET